MLPPWMNLYAILTMATVLASIVGVTEVMTLASQVEAAEGGRTDLLTPLYATCCCGSSSTAIRSRA